MSLPVGGGMFASEVLVGGVLGTMPPLVAGVWLSSGLTKLLTGQFFFLINSK